MTNEIDVGPLHVLRVVLEIGEYLKYSGSYFETTPKGVSRLEDSRAGKFTKNFFLAYFMEFNLAYHSKGKDWSEIQETITYSLYQVSRFDDWWYDKGEFINRLIIYTIRKKAEKENENMLDFYYKSRVLAPLKRFGLVVSRGPDESTIFGNEQE